uniref:hypothetical protein n=1 Tax=Stylonema alsidii TaxID=35155 RepID=UPI001FCCC695|nr:hypothetical protein MW559_pgp153 [Stylonema alsidii]UNJ15139.1 hypothetical protein [Stylonema alsidii]
MTNSEYSYNQSYWPSTPGPDLNYKISIIFANLHIKISQNLSNQSTHNIALDVLSIHQKYYLLHIILKELKKTILENIIFEIQSKQIIVNRNVILANILSNTRQQFLFDKQHDLVGHQKQLINYDAETLYELQNNLTLLLTLSILGSSPKIQTLLNPVITSKIYNVQVEILFENFLIQTANLFIDALLRTNEGISFGFQNHLFNSNYSSIRNIEQFRNNLMWYKFLYRYIVIPKNIYENKYNLYVMSPKGIIQKYIFTQRLSELTQLSTIQLIVTFIIEIQDFLLPKIYNLIQFILKIIFSIIYEPLRNNSRLLWKNIIKDIS